MMTQNSKTSIPTIDLTNIKALSFDCYGTLIDWESGIVNALNPVLAKYNIDLERNELLEIHSELEPQAQSASYKPYRRILDEVLQGFAQRLNFKPTSAEVSALADSVGAWPAFADSSEALQKLQQKFQLAIISNIDNSLIRLSTERLKINCDWVITAEDARAYKPSLSVFNLAFQRMSLKPNQILHVAQSLYHDIVPANSLGMQSVWVNRRQGQSGTGATPPAVAQPTIEVSSLEELANIL